MAKYVVLFEDNDDFAHQRPKFMNEHLAFLEDHTSSIEAAGPLVHCESASSAGGMWLVNADHVEDVTLLIEKDPFWPTGLRKSFQILAWAQVFSDGKRQAIP